MQLYLHRADTLVDHFALGLPFSELQRLKLAGLTAKLDRLSSIIGQGPVPTRNPSTVAGLRDPLLGTPTRSVPITHLQLF